MYQKLEIEFAGRTLSLETGRLAKQAHGSVLAQYGETVVLATVVSAYEGRDKIDFLPLTVDYVEKTFAAGKIPGGFFKREGRPSEKEVLTSRLIDRPVRPLFPEGYVCETQVIATVLSHDLENDPDIVALIGCSAALTISGIPFLGPIAGARVGYKDGAFILNPTMQEMETSELDLVVAGTKEGVLMVESQAKELTEDVMLGAVMFGHKNFQPVIDLIIGLAEICAKEPRDLPPPAYDKKALQAKVKAAIGEGLKEAYGETVKQARYAKLDELKEKAKAAIPAEEFKPEAVIAEIE